MIKHARTAFFASFAAIALAFAPQTANAQLASETGRQQFDLSVNDLAQPIGVEVNMISANTRIMDIITGCGQGYVNFGFPDVSAHYSGGGQALVIAAEANTDTMLIVHTPDGQWLCSDNEGGGFNPRTEFYNPGPGEYKVWLGSRQYNQSANAVIIFANH